MKKIFSIEVDLPKELENDTYLQKEIDSILRQIPKKIEWCYSRYKQDKIDQDRFSKCSHMWNTTYERTSMYDSEYITKCSKCGAYK